MKIYTKAGDKGTTSLIGGTKVSKADLRIDSYGTVDELNSYIGLLADQPINIHRIDFLRAIQNNLFIMGSILALEQNAQFKIPSLIATDVIALENAIDEIDKEVEPLRNFILPGGHQSISFGQIARCVCRRAERLVIALTHTTEIDELVYQYLNRLSDYLFMLCRQMHKELQINEIHWKSR
ncbi:MAG: cob(I)yrinic acid a,c-diamide adenosyltransferase [Cytophagia bacterium]|nr:MAG: cob(I)yrinic acid a,c-diamide adenosyltransferase [Cytophagales bacterium]TAG04268.1 MAG: cob(I)yrinic acid a,c-diamide adenosyltransferase [Cytophagia bacterium]TAG45191.1 MAG: cob(I)yrinic acid a,c-diamide adenosyltransferase [Cytophagia bacterium]TAH29293.1 MAG: cob(I)yrinic acid a,c-diamide adenosyltransferase [Cytophagales bacterium]